LKTRRSSTKYKECRRKQSVWIEKLRQNGRVLLMSFLEGCRV